MNHRHISADFCFLAILTFGTTLVYSGNIDPNDDGSQYSYCENIGWLNFEPSHGPGAMLGDMNLTGYVWAENICWVNFNPEVPGDPNHYGVTIDHEGIFAGWAWGENIGWIHLASSTPVAYKVRTAWITSCVVDFGDLGRFCDLWLQTGSGLKADFGGSYDVDFEDYRMMAEMWLKLCPVGWPLED